MKEGVWTKSVFKNLLQLAQMVYYSRVYEEENQWQKRTKENAQALVTAVKTATNQPEEKNAQRNTSEKGWAYYHCGKEQALRNQSSGWKIVQSQQCMGLRDAKMRAGYQAVWVPHVPHTHPPLPCQSFYSDCRIDGLHIFPLPSLRHAKKPRVDILPSLFYSWENWGLHRWSNLLMVKAKDSHMILITGAATAL